jgi:hypothetical protein
LLNAAKCRVAQQIREQCGRHHSVLKLGLQYGTTTSSKKYRYVCPNQHSVLFSLRSLVAGVCRRLHSCFCVIHSRLFEHFENGCNVLHLLQFDAWLGCIQVRSWMDSSAALWRGSVGALMGDADGQGGRAGAYQLHEASQEGINSNMANGRSGMRGAKLGIPDEGTKAVSTLD